MTSHPPTDTPFAWCEGRVVVDIHDDLDVAALSELAASLEQVVRQRPGRVCIDLSRCRFLDAQVAGLVLSAVDQLRLQGVRPVFRGCRPEVSRLLSLVEVARTEASGHRELVA